MPYKNEFWDEKETKNLFQTLPFYNVLIEKPKSKHLSYNYYMSFHFFDELSAVGYQKHLKDMRGVISLK